MHKEACRSTSGKSAWNVLTWIFLGGPLKRIKIDEVKGRGSKVKSYKAGAAGEPSFPSDFEIYDSVTLQVTDFKSNHNKYYALELHTAKVGKKETFRVRTSATKLFFFVDQSLTKIYSFRLFLKLYTHYGRTDDLHTNPDAGQKETRYYDELDDAIVSPIPPISFQYQVLNYSYIVGRLRNDL